MDLIFCFNTQPPEGGCSSNKTSRIPASSFNTQPPEGGCFFGDKIMAKNKVSTHSHPKVAALLALAPTSLWAVSTHSHPKVAAAKGATPPPKLRRFNTQPPEGGCAWCSSRGGICRRFQHTATRRWLHQRWTTKPTAPSFQHTATRRWLRPHSAVCRKCRPFQHTATRRWLPGAQAFSSYQA